MRQFPVSLIIAACMLIAGLPVTTLAQPDGEKPVIRADENDHQTVVPSLVLAEAGDDQAPTEEEETGMSDRQRRAEERVEARRDVGMWGDLDDAVPFNLLSFNVGLKLSVGHRPYRDVDTDFIVYPIVTRFADLDFTDQVVYCREGNCGVRYASNWYEIGLQGRWNGLGYEPGDSPVLRGMVERDSSIEAGPFVGLRTDFIQIRFLYFTDVMDNSDGEEMRLVFDFPFRFQNGYLVPHIDVYQQDEKYTNYYYGIDPARGDRFLPGCTLAVDCVSYSINDDSTNIDVGFRSQWKVSERWFMHLNARVAFLDDNITRSPAVDNSPDRWWFGIGFSYDIDPTQ